MKHLLDRLHGSDPDLPCPHMRGLVSTHLDGGLSGLSAWYTELHLRHCPQCRGGLARLKALKGRLRSLGASSETPPAAPPSPPALSADRLTALEAALAATEARVTTAE